MSPTALDFEVVPECCIRNEHVELHLGAPINQVLAALRNASKVIRNVELVYCNKDPFVKDITVLLKHEGIRLTFEPKKQLLKLIEVMAFNNISLHYGNTVFSTPQSPADVSKVEHCFGATHPGVYDEKQKTYHLHWRGVSFSFPAKDPSTVQAAYAHGLSSLNFSSMPILERMGIFVGTSPNDIKIPETNPTLHCGNLFPIDIKSVTSCREIVGLNLVLSGQDVDMGSRNAEKLPKLERTILLGDTEAAILCALGAPSRVFYNAEEKMLIQRGSDSKKFGDLDRTDIFFNYFSLGLDVLLDAKTRRVIKLVLHTNTPGHFDFGSYTRAPFEIRYAVVDEPEAAESEVVIGNDSKLCDFLSLFMDKKTGTSTPVVVNRSTSDDTTNPFGSTFCYGTDGLIVEVMDNGCVASVTLYKTGLDTKSYSEQDSASDE